MSDWMTVVMTAVVFALIAIGFGCVVVAIEDWAKSKVRHGDGEAVRRRVRREAMRGGIRPRSGGPRWH